MSENRINIKVPVLCLKVSGEFSRFKKPAGLENLVLTAIGTPALSSDTWGEFLGRLAIPARMAPLFEQVVRDLYSNGVIDSDDFDIGYRIDSLGFTETGRDLFEMGRIKQDPKEYAEEVYFAPYTKYSDPKYRFELEFASPEGFDESRFGDIGFDLDEVKKFLIENKKHIKADKEDEILSIHLDDEPQMLCRKKRIDIQFDETSGDFTFDTDLDPNFIKGYFTASDFLDKREELSALPKGISVPKYTTVPESWESYRYQLPKDFVFKGKLRAYDPGTCSVENAITLNSLGYCFVDILGPELGRGYIFIRKNATVLGLKGESEFGMLASKPLSKSEIADILKQSISTFDFRTYEGMNSILALKEISSSETFESYWIGNHLEQTEDLLTSLSSLNKDRKKWMLKESSLLEEVFCKRGLSAEEIIKILSALGMKIPCTKVGSHLSTGSTQKDLIILDRLLSVSNSKGVLVAGMNLKSSLVSMVLSGKTGDFASAELIALNTLSKSFGRLMSIFAIKSATEYDLSMVDESSSDSISIEYSSANKSMSVVSPLLAAAENVSELQRYMDLIQNLAEIYSKDIPLERLNGYQFGIGVRRKMESLLRSKLKGQDELVGLIERAAKENVITKAEQDMFHKIRIYGNDCAHTTKVPAIDAKVKKDWVYTVNSLEKRLKKGGKA